MKFNKKMFGYFHIERYEGTYSDVWIIEKIDEFLFMEKINEDMSVYEKNELKEALLKIFGNYGILTIFVNNDWKNAVSVKITKKGKTKIRECEFKESPINLYKNGFSAN